MKIRSFVAVETPSTIQEVLIQRTSEIRNHYPSSIIRWVKSGNIHITLVFLGDLLEEDLGTLARSIGFEASQFKPFVISFSKMGVFPNSRNPRVLWAGLKVPDPFIEFQCKIQSLSSNFGIHKEDKPFFPHVTLGRIGRNKLSYNLDNLTTMIRSIDISNINPIKVTNVRIFKSDLRPEGPSYTPIHTIPIGNTQTER